MTASTIPSANQSANILDARLAREERALAFRSLAAAAFAGLAIVLVVLGVSALLLDSGRWLSLPRAVPVLAWLLGAAAAAALAVNLRRRDRLRLTRTAVATSIEREQSLRMGSLRGALEVASTGVLGARAASDVAGRLTPTGSLAPQLERSFNRTAMITGAMALVALTVFVVSARATDDGMSALRHPVAAWRGMLLPSLAFSGLPTDVPRGMPLTLHIDAQGRHAVNVRYSTAGEPERDTTVQVDLLSGQAALALGAITAPVTVRVSDGRSAELTALIKVADRGWIGDVSLYADYPAYLHRTNETLEAVSPVRVPRGTQVRVRAMLRGGAHDALLSNGVDTVRFTSDNSASGDGIVTGKLTADRDAEWRWVSSPTSRNGAAPLPVEVPDALQFVVVPDQSPRVAIVSPGADSAISSTGVVGLIMQATDDHGLSDITLSIWKERPETPSSARERIAIAEPGMPMWEGGATISLAGRDLQPGDKLHVVAIASDDSPWRQASQSAEIVLRVPSLSEQRSMARDLADSIAAKAAQMASAEKQLQQQTADASRSRDMKGGTKPDGSTSPNDAKSQQGKNAMSASAAEKARELGRQQQQMSQKIDSLRQSSKELEERLKSAGALDTALQSRMRDVQRMLRDAVTPEMQKQLADLQKNTDNLNGTQVQQSLEQLAAQQKQMREQLEKSADMLKRAALEGAMQTLKDEAKDLASEQQKTADQMGKNQQGNSKQNAQDARSLADRSRALERDVDQLAKRLDDAGAKPGAARTKAAQPMVDQAADAMQRAAQSAQQQQQNSQQANKPSAQQQQAGQQQNGQQQAGQQQGAQQQQQSGDKQQGKAGTDSAGKSSAAEDQLNKALAGLQKDKEKDQSSQGSKANQQVPPGGSKGSGSEAQKSEQGSSGPPGAQRQTSTDGKDGTKAGDQQGGQQKAQQGAAQQSGSNGQSGAAQDAQQAANAMDRAAKQLSDARDAQVNAWKDDLTKQLDQSINETQQLARQQAELEQRAKQEGAQNLRGEQGAVQQGVQQAAERLEQAGRSSSLLSQRSQSAMGEAQRKVQQATQQMSQSQQSGGSQEGAQSAMREATEALNQALGSLVRDRERVNNAQSASGFTEMMEQLKQLAKQQGSLNGQMQGLQMLPGGMQGQQAQQQSRVLARQQREVAKSLQDVSDADATGRTDALAKEAQQLAQQMERAGLDPNVAARQQQLYRRLLDAGRFLEQDERDDQGPREAKSGSGDGRGVVNGPSSGKNANKFAPPTWNELRGLGPEERRLVIEYFRRINGGN